MKLHHWLKLVGMKQSELAQMVGCSVSTINRHIKHGRILDPDVVVRIYFITMGAVRPDDYYDLENVPPDVQALLDPRFALRKRFLPAKEKADAA
jgi:hypothetical protein